MHRKGLGGGDETLWSALREDPTRPDSGSVHQGRQYEPSAVCLFNADGVDPASVEVVLSYALIPEPEAELGSKYLATLDNDQEREVAKQVIEEYIQPRILTYRVKSL